MPLLDIATTQLSLPNHLGALGAQTLIHGKVLSSSFISGDDKRLASARKSFQFPKKVNFDLGHLEIQRGKLLIKAVATLEPKCLVLTEDGHKDRKNLQLGVESSPLKIQIESSSEDSKELDERERLRRMRISRANKGNTPWNKGRKHSAETLQRIKERTKLAMQDPKVKMKLVNLGHAQSEETKIKIGVGVRMGWQRRREKLMVQETCYFEWQNLIAEASRRGYVGEEEQQWDSYKILDVQLKQEWVESVEQRKLMPRIKGSKRAPKSLEQRRKIAEAISAKWADPAYRERVCSALAKYHGTPIGAERKPRRRSSGAMQSTKRNTMKKKSSDINNASSSETKSQIERLRLRRSDIPLYKDPMVSSKLEMIKNIRAQRAASESKKTEAINRARLLIAEAEKAAKALEVAAMKSPVAKASLIETRKLIAEAVQSIESIETVQIMSISNDGYSSVASSELISQVEKETYVRHGGLNQAEPKVVNGTRILASSKDEDFNFANLTLQDILNGEQELIPTRTSEFDLPLFNIESLIKQSSSAKQLGQLEPNGNAKCEENSIQNGAKVKFVKEEKQYKPGAITKKWVCGRLVEVTEEA